MALVGVKLGGVGGALASAPPPPLPLFFLLGNGDGVQTNFKFFPFSHSLTPLRFLTLPLHSQTTTTTTTTRSVSNAGPHGFVPGVCLFPSLLLFDAPRPRFRRNEFGTAKCCVLCLRRALLADQPEGVAFCGAKALALIIRTAVCGSRQSFGQLGCQVRGTAAMLFDSREPRFRPPSPPSNCFIFSSIHSFVLTLNDTYTHNTHTSHTRTSDTKTKK